MWLSRYLVYFTIYSVVGWVYECIFAICTRKHWENRGFLYGPVIPIYGVGGTALMILTESLALFGIHLNWWQLFLVGSVGSFILEFGTHWTLEKLFHAYWWDYSNMPLNIQGRVCLPYTLCFGLAALLANYAIIPFFVKITSWMTPLCYEIFALIFVAFIAADTTLTISALTDFSRKVASVDKAFNDRMQKVVDNVQDNFEEGKAKFSKEQFANYISGLDALKKSALKRVKGYRNPKIEKANVEEIFEILKKKIKIKK
ncbi:MAG: metal-dependent phosphohydrolase [Lachnospiraceae bacterium]|nr:metal-dependent phosphohydrolase [Lachnospiraceae bacterium]